MRKQDCRIRHTTKSKPQNIWWESTPQKAPITLLLTDIHLSTSNAILFRKLHYWQDMTKAFMVLTDALHPRRLSTAGPSGLIGSSHYQVFIMGVLLKRGGLVQTWQGVDLLNTGPFWPLSGPHFNTILRGELAEVEFDGLGTYHQLKSPEPQTQLGQQERQQRNIDGRIQRQYDGVCVSHNKQDQGCLQ